MALGEELLTLSPTDRRTLYLARAGNLLFFFRICTAMPGAGYAEYAAGLGIADGPGAAAGLVARARGYILECCTLAT
jgi:hypothetical protein